jgi:hypothetical protein
MSNFVDNPGEVNKYQPVPKFKKGKIGVIVIGNNHYFVLYNDRKCVIKITCKSKDIREIVKILVNKFGNKMVYWVSVSLKQDNCIVCITNFIENGFTNVYITDKTPFGKKIEHSIALERIGKTKNKEDRELLNALYVLQQYKKKDCSVYTRFSSHALSFLKNCCTNGTNQKELGGALYIENIENDGGDKYVYVIGVDEDNIKTGNEESVDILPTRYNFHSHPRDAYIRHSVKNAWPSSTDYNGYYNLGNKTIFHCVTTLEGIYIISFGTYWVNNLKDISKKYIEDNYDIEHKEKYTPQEYVKKVNNLKYKGHSIYNVKFFDWNNSKTIFSVTYKKDGLNCFASD